MLRVEGHTPGTVMLPKESFPVSEGNYSPLRGQWLEGSPGQDRAATRLDGSALYANSKEGAAPGLAMDHASRMERAKQMGFDTDTTWYHGTNQPLDEINSANLLAADAEEAAPLGLTTQSEQNDPYRTALQMQARRKLLGLPQ